MFVSSFVIVLMFSSRSAVNWSGPILFMRQPSNPKDQLSFYDAAKELATSFLGWLLLVCCGGDLMTYERANRRCRE